MEVGGRLYSHSTSSCDEILCQPCLSDGDSELAEGFCETCGEYFCSSCLKFHRKQAITKHHVIKSLDEIPRVVKQTDKCSKPCEIHRLEIVKFYCKAHDEVGCGDCMVLEHKPCDVKLKNDIADDTEKRSAAKNVNDKLEHFKKMFTAQVEEIKENVKAAGENKVQILKEIKEFRSEFNSYMDRVENELKREVEDVYLKELSRFTKALDDYKTMGDEIKEMYNALEIKSENVNQAFVTAKLTNKKLQKLLKAIEHSGTQNNFKTFTFRPLKDFVSLKEKKKPLGKIMSNNNHAYLARKLEGKANYETLKCSFTGAAMTSQYELVLADYNNVKVLNVRDNKITSVYKCVGSPWDVCSIGPDLVAVTIPKTGVILIMNTKNGLSISSRFTVMQGCRGIDFRNDVYAVSFTNPPLIQMLNTKGDIIHERHNTDKLFRFPAYIAIGKDMSTVFVSDMDAHSVYELKIDGELVATIKDDVLKSPRGIAMTADETLMVCGGGGDLSFIELDTKEVHPMKLIGIENAAYVTVYVDQRRMYLGEDFNATGRNEISVFDLE